MLVTGEELALVGLSVFCIHSLKVSMVHDLPLKYREQKSQLSILCDSIRYKLT